MSGTNSKRSSREFAYNDLSVFDYNSSESESDESEPTKNKRRVEGIVRDLQQPLYSHASQIPVEHIPDEIVKKGYTIHRKFYSSKYASNLMPEPGPTEVEKYNGEVTPFKVFDSWTKELFSHSISISQDYCNEKEMMESNEKDIFNFNKKRFYNFITLFLAAGIVQCRKYVQYWEESSSSCGLLGNQFFKDTMGQNKFHKMNRLWHANIDFIVRLHNDMSKIRRYPTEDLSIDDDKYKWTGRGGLKKKNDKKTDKTGIDSYKIVDRSGYCFGMFFEDTHEVKEYKKEMSTHQALMKYADDLTPPGAYRIYIDAGLLSGIDNAEMLAESGRKFVIMMPSNKNSDVNEFLQQNLKKHQWKIINHDTHICLSYYAKDGTKGKAFCNLVFNFNDGADVDTVTNYNKTTGNHDPTPAPKALALYRTCHTMVDSRKATITHIRNPFRQRRPMRAKLHDVMYSLIMNSFVQYCSLAKKDDKYTLQDYLLAIIPAIRFPKAKAVHRTIPSTAHIVYHQLISQGNRRRCRVCSTSRTTFCSKCKPDERGPIYLCQGICALKFHNPNRVIEE